MLGHQALRRGFRAPHCGIKTGLGSARIHLTSDAKQKKTRDMGLPTFASKRSQQERAAPAPIAGRRPA